LNPRFKPLEEVDSDDSTGKLPNEVSGFRYAPAFKELHKRVGKFSGKSDENDFEIWFVDFMEATSDCRWTDVDRTRWFSWFLTGSAKVTWQRTVTNEDKSSWERIVSQYLGDSLEFTTAYQRCHELQYDNFGSVQGLLESMRDYQRMAPQKLSDANLESIYGIKFQSSCKKK